MLKTNSHRYILCNPFKQQKANKAKNHCKTPHKQRKLHITIMIDTFIARRQSLADLSVGPRQQSTVFSGVCTEEGLGRDSMTSPLA